MEWSIKKVQVLQMKAAVELYVDSIIMVMIVTCCVFFISSSMRNAQARNFHSTTVAKIEASAGSEKVILESMEEAKAKGFTLQISPTCLYEDKKYYYVRLMYEYNVPFLGIKRESKIEGYAR